METINNQELELQQQMSETLDTVNNIQNDIEEVLSQYSENDLQNALTEIIDLLMAEDIDKNTQLLLDAEIENNNIEYKLAA